MKTKEEVIKESYGNFWDQVKKHVDDNGWITFDKWFKLIGHKIDYDYSSFKLEKTRPKSLQGIEDNNGWIRVESEEYLPKEGMTYYLICIDNRPSIHPYNLAQIRSLFTDGFVTHYKKIVKPLPPLY